MRHNDLERTKSDWTREVRWDHRATLCAHEIGGDEFTVRPAGEGWGCI